MIYPYDQPFTPRACSSWGSFSCQIYKLSFNACSIGFASSKTFPSTSSIFSIASLIASCTFAVSAVGRSGERLEAQLRAFVPPGEQDSNHGLRGEPRAAQPRAVDKRTPKYVSRSLPKASARVKAEGAHSCRVPRVRYSSMGPSKRIVL